jgi:hypothetical protein
MRCLAQVNANGMYLHVDDPPCQKLPLRSCSRKGIKRRTISLVGLWEVKGLIRSSAKEQLQIADTEAILLLGRSLTKAMAE